MGKKVSQINGIASHLRRFAATQADLTNAKVIDFVEDLIKSQYIFVGPLKDDCPDGATFFLERNGLPKAVVIRRRYNTYFAGLKRKGLAKLNAGGRGVSNRTFSITSLAHKAWERFPYLPDQFTQAVLSILFEDESEDEIEPEPEPACDFYFIDKLPSWMSLIGANTHVYLHSFWRNAKVWALVREGNLEGCRSERRRLRSQHYLQYHPDKNSSISIDVFKRIVEGHKFLEAVLSSDDAMDCLRVQMAYYFDKFTT